jgi:hypothetical protein
MLGWKGFSGFNTQTLSPQLGLESLQFIKQAKQPTNSSSKVVHGMCLYEEEL